MKHLLPVFIVLIFTQLLISCGDSSSESGTLSRSSPPKSLSLIAKNSEIHSRSSECQSVASDGTSKVPYINYPINKVLFRCDSKSGNQLFSWSGRSESTKVLVRWAREFCADDYGSSATIIDVNNAYCKSNSSASNSSTDPFEGYVNKYPDLVSAYNANSQGLSKSNWGKNHYCASGRYEGRTYPGLSTASCGTSGTTSGSATSWPSGNYDYLCKYNECDRFSYRIRRWRTNSVNIISTNSIYYNGLRGSWPVNLNLGSRGGITIESGSGNWCGAAMPLMYTDGTIRACRIKINNVAHAARRCGLLKATVIHEVGHCLGFLGHTTDGGLMDATANQATGANSNTRNMISLLYSLPPGTDISRRLSTFNRSGTEKLDSYEFNGSDPTLIPPKWYYSK